MLAGCCGQSAHSVLQRRHARRLLSLGTMHRPQAALLLASERLPDGSGSGFRTAPTCQRLLQLTLRGVQGQVRDDG